MILAANPKNTSQLRLSEEVREIEEALKRADNRSQFTLQTIWAVRPRDLMRAMTELKPNIIHFCGHGQAEGITLEDNQGNAQLINLDGLTNLFKSFTNQVECVLLNACYSKSQAEAIGQYIDYVVGLEQEIKDKDAIEFAVSFYDALGAGEAYESAYRLGCIAMQLIGSPEELLPSLLPSTSNSLVNSKGENNLSERKRLSETENRFFQSLPSILNKYDGFIDDFIEKLNFDTPTEICISNGIRDLFDAELVYIYKHDTDSVLGASRASSLSTGEECDINELNSFLRQNYFKVFTSDKPHRIFLEKGLFFSEEATLIAIPREQGNSLILILKVSSQMEELEDVIGTLLGCLYEFSGSFGQLKTKENFRDRMYDALKHQYHYVSDNAYEARFENFRKTLKDNVQVYFEPILFFDRREESATIFGWEALARDPKIGKAPFHLFKVAETWGVRFQTELDLYILESALETYKNAAENAKTLRYDEKKWLSVNVYPSSILRSKYNDLLNELLHNRKLVSGKKLILEISEKTLLPAIISDDKKGINSFKAVARKYRRDYDISFAVDDFGAGNAAVSRLEDVDPTYVKIDRDILHFEKKLGASIIEYLVNLKFDFNYLTIVEGFDEYSNFSLRELVVDLGVEYIQGHHFGIATPEIKARLDKEQYQKIFEMLGWRK